MDLFTGLATLAIGFYRAKRESDQEIKQNEAWFKLSLSLMGTGLVTFLGIFSVAGLGALAAGSAPWVCFLTALFVASGTTAAAILSMWKRSTLARGIPILAPMSVEKEVLQGGFAYTEPKQTTGGK